MKVGGGGAFGRSLSKEDGDLKNGISAPIQKTPEMIPGFFQPHEDTGRSWLSVSQKGPSPAPNMPAQTPDLGLHLPERQEINFCCLEAPKSMLFHWSSLN
jgi:hypothetical protein